ncbi:glycoside hydrolase family 127 protein [Fulvivirgaceae bacterium PWU4]|uniref:Glycoside hydrolase family 127 protein n=1 Tax=Chryseosolibacter histidini TaxID=2782349 RepID=A0AAP2DJN6_9BACT|nr:glycoside hydrolase family 127 protein [Chryseosolibacter histidini]MBT1697608.1 glycoside hydrolase family 127 protein [Chryseosolibacter histidini]
MKPNIAETWKHLFYLCSLLSAATVQAQHRDYPIQAVPFTNVKLNDGFWMPRIRINHTVTIPASFERCESTGRVKNFEMAAARSGKFCTVYPFDDTDIYKTIEGASFSLSLYPDKALESYIDTLIIKISNAQEPDGYLYTARTINPAEPHRWAGKERWEKERELSHELYNSGHLYEAAAAHYQATGKRSLLDIALKNADLVCAVFGPDKKHVAPGHEVIEMGLVKLYRITGAQKYLETAKYFIDERGHYSGYDATSKDPWKNGAYWQDHKPVVAQDEAIGHAVRAGYLYAAMADVAALTGDAAYLKAIDGIWDNVVSKKIYVQGGIGAIGDGERFGDNYQLPNATAYNETCAAIANVYWNYRMFMLHGHSRYMDILERSLYNGLISGVGLDGKSFFYTNAMEITKGEGHKDREVERSGWFPCSCCPTNVTRLIPSIGGYVYGKKDNDLFVNLFISSNATLQINKRDVSIIQENNYPWNGNLLFRIDPSAATPFALKLRIPGWAANEAVPSDLYRFAAPLQKKVEVKVNGKAVAYTVNNGYATISRTWKKGDVVEMVLPMEVRKIVANPEVKDDLGRMALQRGPLVYCAEWPDNNGMVSNIIVPADASFTTEARPDLLNGITILKTEASAVIIDSASNTVSTQRQPFTAIPYYAWAHRGKGEMMIWLPTSVKQVTLISRE